MKLKIRKKFGNGNEDEDLERAMKASTNATIINVDGDGSCLYRAILGYALYNINNIKIRDINIYASCSLRGGKKSEIINDELIRDDYQDEWVSCFRNFIVKNCDKDLNLLYKSLLEKDSYTFEEIIKSSFPSWFKKEKINTLDKFKRLSFNDFKTLYIKYTKKLTTYASQIDVEIISRIFKEKFNYNIKIIYNSKQIPKKPSDKTIYLLLLENEHYNFVKYEKMTELQKTKITMAENPQEQDYDRSFQLNPIEEKKIHLSLESIKRDIEEKKKRLGLNIYIEKPIKLSLESIKRDIEEKKKRLGLI